MRFAKIKFVAVLAVAATVIGLSTTAAFAADYTVAAGGLGSSVSVTNSGNLVFTDTTGGASITCTGFSAPGVAQIGAHSFAPATPSSGGGTPFDAALTITTTATSFSGCSNPIVGTATIAAGGSWKFGVVSKGFGTASGYLNFVQLHVAVATCSFDAKGYLPGTYTNSTGNFVTSAGAGLVISNVSGSACSLIHVANGHLASLGGTLHVNPPFVIS